MSAATKESPNSWPPEISPSLMHDNGVDHGGLIVVVTAFCLSLTFFGLAFRLYAWRRIRRSVNSSDVFLGITTIVSWMQISLVIDQAHLGWGKIEALIEPERWQHIYKLGYSSDILYVLILGLSRITTLMFFHTIFNIHSKKPIYGSFGLSFMGSVVSIIICALRCSFRAPWQDVSSKCSVLFPHWIGITAIDIFSEFLVLICPFHILSRLNMSTPKKVLLSAVFGVRVILILLSAIHLLYIHSQMASPADPFLSGTYATLTAEIHLTVSVLVHVSSSLKPFFAVFEDENGLAYSENATQFTERSLATITGGGSRKLKAWQQRQRLQDSRYMYMKKGSRLRLEQYRMVSLPVPVPVPVPVSIPIQDAQGRIARSIQADEHSQGLSNYIEGWQTPQVEIDIWGK